MTVRTPFSLIASRVALGPRALRWGTTASLVVSVLIVLGGGVVRVTGSGLGCPTWPTCDGGSLAPIPELGVHGVIEFANRLLTAVLIVAVGWAIVAARLQRVHPGPGRRDDRMLTRLAWSQFWLVVANAVAGGITVLARLNPWVVALHFVLAMGLLATATLTWHRARALLRAESPPPAPAPVRALAWVTAAVTLLLILVGTVVSGAGPHSGDSAAVHRIPLNWVDVTVLHGVLGTAVLVLGLAIWLLLRRDGRHPLAARRAGAFVVVVLAQAALGLVQALTGVPEALVALHLVGAALVWVGVLRVLLDTDTRLFAVRPDPAAGRGSATGDRTAHAQPPIRSAGPASL